MNLKIRNMIKSAMAKGVSLSEESFLSSLGQEFSSKEEAKTYYDLVFRWSFIDFTEDFEEILSYVGPEIEIIGENHRREKIPLEHEDFQLSVEHFAFSYAQTFNPKSPFISFSAVIQGDKFRVSITHASLSPNQFPVLSVRRLILKDRPPTYNEYAYSLCQEAFTQKKNMVIVGPTASGKTTLMRQLLKGLINDQKEGHCLVIEDTHELFLKGTNSSNSINYLCPSQSSDNSITLNDLLAMGLRLRPERILLGEVRSSEVVPFFTALNCGHRGMMGTLHANSAPMAVDRLALLFCLYAKAGPTQYSMTHELFAKNLECVVYMEHKVIKEIIEVIGSNEGKTVYRTLYKDGDTQEKRSQQETPLFRKVF